jgi:hypothetical protein
MREERKGEELRAQDRAHLDRRWQEDMAWLELSGNVPARQEGSGRGPMASFESNPILWTIVVLALGGAAFLLVTGLLF